MKDAKFYILGFIAILALVAWGNINRIDNTNAHMKKCVDEFGPYKALTDCDTRCPPGSRRKYVASKAYFCEKQ